MRKIILTLFLGLTIALGTSIGSATTLDIGDGYVGISFSEKKNLEYGISFHSRRTYKFHYEEISNTISIYLGKIFDGESLRFSIGIAGNSESTLITTAHSRWIFVGGKYFYLPYGQKGLKQFVTFESENRTRLSLVPYLSIAYIFDDQRIFGIRYQPTNGNVAIQIGWELD